MAVEAKCNRCEGHFASPDQMACRPFWLGGSVVAPSKGRQLRSVAGVGGVTALLAETEKENSMTKC